MCRTSKVDQCRILLSYQDVVFVDIAMLNTKLVQSFQRFLTREYLLWFCMMRVCDVFHDKSDGSALFRQMCKADWADVGTLEPFVCLHFLVELWDLSGDSGQLYH